MLHCGLSLCEFRGHRLRFYELGVFEINYSGLDAYRFSIFRCGIQGFEFMYLKSKLEFCDLKFVGSGFVELYRGGFYGLGALGYNICKLGAHRLEVCIFGTLFELLILFN